MFCKRLLLSINKRVPRRIYEKLNEVIIVEYESRKEVFLDPFNTKTNKIEFRLNHDDDQGWVVRTGEYEYDISCKLLNNFLYHICEYYDTQYDSKETKTADKEILDFRIFNLITNYV
jgi:hypothetical protein